MQKFALTSAVALVALTTGASAYDGYSAQREIDRRQFRQEQRIQEGVRQGDLTRREYLQLEAEQARIRELERRARADGRIDPYEAARIRRAQNEASRHIYQERHDGERRGDGWRNRRWW
jgi:uncharacterized membrane protein YebE (DUF533 family)